METRERADTRSEQIQPQKAGGLEQVRELLFGAIYRELEWKLSRAEGNLSTRSEELQQEAKRRIEALEAHLAKEIESVVARIEREHTSQVDALARVGREHREQIATLEERVEKLEQAMVRAQRETRQELLTQTNRFLDEIHRSRNELKSLLDREVALLHGEDPELPSASGSEEAPSAHTH